MVLNGASKLLCKWNSKALSSAEVTGATSIICSGSLIDVCYCLSPWYQRIDSWSYQFHKLASAVFESIKSTENARMHSHTVHPTNGNEKLNLVRTFFACRILQEDTTYLLLWWQWWHLFLEFLCDTCTTQVSQKYLFSLWPWRVYGGTINTRGKYV